ncbi:MAG TPA: sigma-70 family RNA polymerase sigma factor [Planctomycetota bacterium]|nr:sigma-70 family RNA polymerase sigma factor [Planctomycetota bacterium]
MDLDRDQVLRARKGDRGAFEGIVRATARLVWAYVHGLVKDPSWTEDLVQETYLKGWESIGTLKDPDAFRGWLFTIARRLAWRHDEVAGRSAAVAEMPKKAAPAAESQDAGEHIRAALARLPERYRLPVTLHFVNGLEYGEISKSLGLANGSLRGLIARGTKKLRDDLAPWWRSRNERA